MIACVQTFPPPSRFFLRGGDVCTQAIIIIIIIIFFFFFFLRFFLSSLSHFWNRCILTDWDTFYIALSPQLGEARHLRPRKGRILTWARNDKIGERKERWPLYDLTTHFLLPSLYRFRLFFTINHLRRKDLLSTECLKCIQQLLSPTFVFQQN